MQKRVYPYLLIILGFILLAFVVYYSSLRGEKETLHSYGGKTMGTTYTVKFRGDSSDEANRLKIQTEKILQEINDEMSTWKQNSTISRFNSEQDLDWFEVSESMVELLEVAGDISRITEGLYDVTISPLIDLWGFGRENIQKKPKLEEILKVKQYIGMEKINIKHHPPSLQKTVKGVAIDLSSIAKGYGVDLIAEMLEQEGIKNYLVEIGGEVRVKGHKNNRRVAGEAQGESWKIAIEKPISQEKVIQQLLNLSDISMATSGDYRNFFEEDGQKYAHIINPNTGYPTKSRLASVTVFAHTTALADAWATALFVSGESKARSLAKAIGLPVLMILHPKPQQELLEIELSPALEAIWDKIKE